MFLFLFVLALNSSVLADNAPPILCVFKLKLTLKNGDSYICFSTGPEDLAKDSGEMILQRLVTKDVPLYKEMYGPKCGCLKIFKNVQKEIAPYEFYATTETEPLTIDSDQIAQIINLGVLAKFKAWIGISTGFEEDTIESLKNVPFYELDGPVRYGDDGDSQEKFLIYDEKMAKEKARGVCEAYTKRVWSDSFKKGVFCKTCG